MPTVTIDRLGKHTGFWLTSNEVIIFCRHSDGNTKKLEVDDLYEGAVVLFEGDLCEIFLFDFGRDRYFLSPIPMKFRGRSRTA